MKKIIFFLIILSACNSSVKTNQEIDFSKSEMTWLNQATIYEVNLRQYTSDGTINSFRKKLPKLKELGVDIHRENMVSTDTVFLVDHTNNF